MYCNYFFLIRVPDFGQITLLVNFNELRIKAQKLNFSFVYSARVFVCKTRRRGSETTLSVVPKKTEHVDGKFNPVVRAGRVGYWHWFIQQNIAEP